MDNGWIDLNADLGEGVTDDEGLLAVVTSANLACGFHAGDEATMRAVCDGAVARGVVVGAQVSYADREGFGRRHMDVAPEVLTGWVAEQVGLLERVAATSVPAAAAISSSRPTCSATQPVSTSRRDVHVATAEALPVGVGDLRPHHHAPGGSALADRAHRGLVARVEPAGEVGAGHHREQTLVVGDALAEVGVQVDPSVPHADQSARAAAPDHSRACRPPVTEK